MLSIFSSSQYNDKVIKTKIDLKLKELLLTRPKEDLKIEQDNYDYSFKFNGKYNGKHHPNYGKFDRNEHYSNRSSNKGGYNRKHYQKNNRNGNGNGKGGYYNSNNSISTRGKSITKQYAVPGNANANTTSNYDMKTYETEIIELNDIKKSIQEIDEDQRTTSKTSTTPSKSYGKITLIIPLSIEITSIASIEAIPEISLTYLTEKEEKENKSSTNESAPNKSSVTEKSINPNLNQNPQCYPSRLFPGVFFSKPIDTNSNPLLQYQIKRNDCFIKNPFAQACNYYMLGNNTKYI